MEFDAAAPAPATDEAMPTVAEPTSEATSDDAYGAVFDRLMGDDPEEAAEEAPKQAEVAEEAPEPAVDDDPVPTDLPVEIRDAWKNIPPEARRAVTDGYREMAKKVSEQGRLVQGIAPIRDVLVEAGKTIPSLMNMTPQQVAAEVLQLSNISHQFNTQPVETIMGLIEKHGLKQAVSQALGGQEITQDARHVATLQNEIRTLQQQLQRVADPEYLRAQVSQFTSQERVMGDLEAFSAKAEHWASVEQHLPDVIPLVQKQLGANAAPADVLAKAYDLALSIYLPDAKAQQQPAAQAQAVADPKKAESVLKAKSVNVSGRPNGSQRQLSEDEAMAAIYDRAHRK